MGDIPLWRPTGDDGEYEEDACLGFNWIVMDGATSRSLALPPYSFVLALNKVRLSQRYITVSLGSCLALRIKSHCIAIGSRVEGCVLRWFPVDCP